MSSLLILLLLLLILGAVLLDQHSIKQEHYLLGLNQ
jgi:hypothetical protein